MKADSAKFVMMWMILVLGMASAAAAPSAADAPDPLRSRIDQARASGDVGALMAAVPEVEKLWPKDPRGYFECLQTAAPGIEAVFRNNPRAKDSLVMIFTNAMAKRCPTSEVDLACLEAKWNVAMTCVNMVGESGQQAWLLDLAHFVGEVRERKIPNYTNRGSKLPEAAHALLQRTGVPGPASLTRPEDKQEYERIMAANKADLRMNDLQLLLWRIDDTLTSRLIQACSRFSNDPKAAPFLDQIASTARLTPQERAKM